MTYSQLNAVLAETGQSPEQLAPTLGVASMTIRRWQKKPGSAKVPKGYERTVLEGVYQLLAEGHLDSGSEAVQKMLAGSASLSFAAVLKSLEITDAVTGKGSGESQQDKMTIALSQIGVNEKRRAEVDQSRDKLQGFKKLGKDWNERISALWIVVRSTKLTPIDKLVAYGALFYLIFPFDLIPDHLPVVGLVDDFGILGFAMAYYLRKFPEIIKSSDNTN